MSKAPLFHEGEAIDANDLNDVVIAATQRAWEIPGYGNVFAGARESYIGESAAAFPMSNPFAAYATKMCFSSGPGPDITSPSTLTVTVREGIIGQFIGSGLPGVMSTPGAVSNDMLWAVIRTPVVMPALAASAPGNIRAVLLQASLEEVETDAQTRHFEDSVTGALSSSSLVKRRSVVPTFSYSVGGTETTVGSVPLAPSLEFGKVLVAILWVGNTSVTKIVDATIPWGRPTLHSPLVAKAAIWNGADWTIDAASLQLEANGSSKVLYAPCPVTDGFARVLSVSVSCFGAAAVALVSIGGGDPPVDLRVLTANMDGYSIFDMLGAPISGSISALIPYWGNAQTKKNHTGFGGRLALRITSISANTVVHAVSWNVIGP